MPNDSEERLPRLREYSDEDVERFLEEDRLDPETQEIAEKLNRALKARKTHPDYPSEPLG